MSEYDVVVIGGGAAGLSAALVLSRARRRVAVVDAGQPRNAPAAHMHGFLGWDGAPPATLLMQGRGEVTSYGGELISGTVTDLIAGGGSNNQPHFEVTLDDGASLQARRVLVTTGLRDELPDIPGVAERWGRDLLHCPYCHGYEVRDQPLGVLGGTPDAVLHALLVRQWSADVVFFTHASELTPQDREQLDRASHRHRRRHRRPTRRRRRPVDRCPARVRPGRGPVRGLRPPSSSRTATCWFAWAAPPTTTGGSSPTASAPPPCPACGSLATRPTPAPRSSPPPAKGSAAAIAINADLVEEDTATDLSGFRQGLRL